jgi:hypothetical protein
LAIIHFIRRRPDTWWLYVILFLGPIGAAIYLFAEALPDIGLVGHSLKGFSRRKRIAQLEAAIHDNPSPGNYEELGDLYMDEGKLQPARAAFNNAIDARAYTLDPFYQRGVCAILLGDAAAALPDLERTVAEDSTTTSIEPPDCSPTPTRRPGKKIKPRHSSAKSRLSLPPRRPTSTSQASSHPRGATPRRANGRRRFSTKSQTCRVIFAAANVPGSVAPTRC